MSRLHLVCYAAGAPVHLANRARLVASAHRHGVDEILAYGPHDIDPDFRARHESLFTLAEGAGYWLWKPYFILKALERAAPGDFVLYVDAGAYLRRDPRALCGDGEAVFFQNDYLNRHFTKRDAFVLTGTDVAACHDARQLDAAMMGLRNTPASRHFMKTWLECCSDPRMVNDAPNVCGLPNFPGFGGHRHDQALLSLLLWRDGGQLRHTLHARARKHDFIVHHRRRDPRVPIWWWHMLHDGAEALARRIWDFDPGRTVR